jgi:hypothetical protein
MSRKKSKQVKVTKVEASFLSIILSSERGF